MPTTKHQLTNTWIEIAAGACYVEPLRGDALLHIGASEPGVSEDAVLTISANSASGPAHRRPFSYGMTENVYARAEAANAEILVITE